jgi:hypothetical protein
MIVPEGVTWVGTPKTDSFTDYKLKHKHKIHFLSSILLQAHKNVDFIETDLYFI